jgi:hypothetical protein
VARPRKIRPVWTADAVRALGVSTDLETAGSVFGLSRSVAYDLLGRDQFPVPTFKVGRRVVVPTASILYLLGLDAADDERPEPPTTLRAVQ